jgi:hypothetical protein
MGGQTERVWSIMEFLQKNARAIIIALLAAGVVVSISASGDNTNDETATQESSEVASTDEASESQAEAESTSADTETVSGEDNSTSEQAEATEATSDIVRNEDDYYVAAVAGDSQTTLVRKLITQYESENDVQLSATQRLYTETNLVDDIGQTESIEIGEEVKLTGADMKVRVEEAQNLSKEILALWTKYL